MRGGITHARYRGSPHIVSFQKEKGTFHTQHIFGGFQKKSTSTVARDTQILDLRDHVPKYWEMSGLPQGYSNSRTERRSTHALSWGLFSQAATFHKQSSMSKTVRTFGIYNGIMGSFKKQHTATIHSDDSTWVALERHTVTIA